MLTSVNQSVKALWYHCSHLSRAGKVQTAHHQMVAGLDIGVTHAIYDGQFCKPV
ncbi:Uncharacterised protein [Klebsiella pneumoniae]|nr:Uncharacterised protein [Klebsiella pneumoniae]